MADCTVQCQVVQDVANGWEGFCLGLQLLNSTTTPAVCREACCEDPNCEVWQWGNPRDLAGNPTGSCYKGRGLECSSDRFDNFLVLAGQRISHGTVSQTIKLEASRWCTGSGMRQAAGGPVSDGGTYKKAVDDCQEVCYRDAACSIWEYSTKLGCWYGYSDKCYAAESGAQTMVAGERVARACVDGVDLQGRTDYVTVFGIIGLVAFFLTCCAMLVLLCPCTRDSCGHRGRNGRMPSRDLRADEELQATPERGQSRGAERSFSSDSACSMDAHSDMGKLNMFEAPPAKAASSGVGSFESWSGYQSNTEVPRLPSAPSTLGSSAPNSIRSFTPLLQPQPAMVQVSQVAPYMPLMR